MVWLTALGGGVLIGAAAIMMMALLGRVVGISGIFAGLLTSSVDRGVGWRWAFLVGLILGPPLVGAFRGVEVIAAPVVSTPWMFLAGLLVGLGVTIGSGCTSGHGVCGLARFSRRSLVAVISFMASALVTVYVTRHGL
ncbi:YeeE/YedE family protein [Azospirillaceae bacterium]